MTTRAAQRSLRDELGKLRAEVERLGSENAGLLDILNAVLFAQGGRIIVSRAQLIAADRRSIEVTHRHDAVIIETRKRDGEDMRSLTQQLWLPGQT